MVTTKTSKKKNTYIYIYLDIYIWKGSSDENSVQAREPAAALKLCGQNNFFANFEIIGIMQTKWGNKTSFHPASRIQAKTYCENEVLKFPPLHMHFNVEMLLWSTACLWCIINIFPLFGCSHNERLCRLMGKKTLQWNSPGKALAGFIWHVVHLENCGFSATSTKAPGTGAS